MNKQKRILTSFQKVEQLQLSHASYKKCVHAFCEWQLTNDSVSSDLTTELLISHVDKENTKAAIITRQEIIVAGIAEITYLLETFTDIDYRKAYKDGSKAKKGQDLLELSGTLSEILSCERTILNILQRLSGIATATNALVTKLESKIYVAATRKTQWSLLDKKAVALGGGLTHRLSLADGILIKDNHLEMLRKKFSLHNEYEAVVKAIELTGKKKQDLLIEIEIEQSETLEKLFTSHHQVFKKQTIGILLDNFTPEKAQKMLASLGKKYDVSSVIFEASGGITAETINRWTKAGIDIISLGALTHSTRAVDISLDIKK